MQIHNARICHIKNQNAQGAGFVEAYMKKNCKFDVVETNKIISRLSEARAPNSLVPRVE